MDETERMTALKKAYAEIILNSAKESAARVMVSERKAYEYQRDLSVTKEEALRLLMRVKMMMEDKINEVETKSLVQQKKIEELEAQLQEAEDVVSSLRAELSDAQAEVERLSKIQQMPYDKSDLIKESVVLVETKHYGNRVEEEPVVASTVKANSLTLNHCSSAARHNSANDYLGDRSYVGNPDMTSILMRTKEPELYRNGCTQRIRAFESNLLDGHLSVPGRLDNMQDSDKLIKEEKHHTGHCVLPSPRPAKKCMVMKKPAAVRSGKRLRVGPLVGAKQRRMLENERAEVEEATNVNVTAHNTLAIDSFCRKRKRGVRVRRSELSLLKSVPVQIKECFEVPNVSLSGTRAADSLSILSKFYNDEDEHNLDTNIDLGVPCDISKPAAPSESQAVADEAATKDDMELADSLVLMTQENGPRNDSVVTSLQTTLNNENDSSVNPDDKFADANDGISCQLPKERVLKYTFHRKRKKEAIRSTDDNEQQQNPSKKKPVKKQNCAVEGPKSSLVAESSRDSRRLAQVARQLISLSEKKWWT